MKLSVIIPVYNAEKYISRMLGCFLKADIKEYEIIIIDDGSTDNSLSVCRSFAERFENIRVFRQKNSGPSAARNLGIENAAGEWICFADADDYIVPDIFAYAVKNLTGLCTDMMICDFQRVSENGAVLDKVYQIEETSSPITDRDYMDRFLDDGECVWNVWRCFFKKEFIDKNRLRFRTEVNCAEDMLFMVQALLSAEVPAFFHAPYYRYVVNYGNTLTRIYTAKRLNDLVTMIKSSLEVVDAKKDMPYSKRIGEKLAREYMKNIAIYMQVPTNQREEAAKILLSGKYFLLRSNSIYEKFIKACVDIFGIPAAGAVLYVPKRVKQIVRKVKTDKSSEGTAI